MSDIDMLTTSDEENKFEKWILINTIGNNKTYKMRVIGGYLYLTEYERTYNTIAKSDVIYGQSMAFVPDLR